MSPEQSQLCGNGIRGLSRLLAAYPDVGPAAKGRPLNRKPLFFALPDDSRSVVIEDDEPRTEHGLVVARVNLMESVTAERLPIRLEVGTGHRIERKPRRLGVFRNDPERYPVRPPSFGQRCVRPLW